MSERVLVVGSGGREDAITWQLEQSPQVERAEKVQYTTVENTLNFARENGASFVVVGPDNPLAQGIVDRFNEEKIPIFGPTKEASRLEWDKAYADEFMNRHNIPHPKSRTFRNIDEARSYLQEQDPKKIVVKANGLALGKGVILPGSQDEAELAITEIFQGKYGDQDTVIIQERLLGREVSFICLTDEVNIVPLLPAQDHKRLKDNDQGPNTGGMGAFAPAELDPATYEKIMETIVNPTIQGLQEDGIKYTGALYFGLMLTADGPKVLEYNCRVGDPETQPQMFMFSSDFYSALKTCIDGNLTSDLVRFRQGVAVCVVLASEGYPQNPVTGREIRGLDTVTDPNVVVYHAATETKDGKIFTAGGRVLGVTAYGLTLEEARERAYSQIGEQGIHFPGMQFRTDIGIRII